MVRVSRGVAAAIVLGTVLLGGAAHAQTSSSTTTTTTTTTTTLQPHPFSRATAACVRQAKRQFNCEKLKSTCSAAYQTAYSNCFKAPNGVKCAKTCLTKAVACLTAVPTTQKTCRNGCRTTRKADKAVCPLFAKDDSIWATGDTACLQTADSNFHLCLFGCTEATIDCRTAFTFCIADCANL